MFEGIDDYNFDGTKKKKYGCLTAIIIASLVFLLGFLIGWLI